MKMILQTTTKFLFSIVFIIISHFSFSQNVSLENAKEGDYVIASGKGFFIVKDDGEEWYWKKIQQYFYVDHVLFDKDGTNYSVHLTDGKEVQFTVHFNEIDVNNYEDITISTYLIVCDTCDPKGNYVPYICNDSLALGSTHKSRPFKYGFNYTYEQCKKHIPDIEFMELQPGQKIASVGAASGWYEAALATNTEGISYTVEDVDKYVLNKHQFNAVLEHFMSVSEKTVTNDFTFVLGTYDSTCLPRHQFDKIIIRNAYHEFTGKWKMLYDLKSKLKPEGGEIILMDEGFSSLYYTYYHEGCGIRSLQAKDVIRFFANQGFYLTKMNLPLNALTNNLIFSTDKAKSENYLESLKEINKIIFKVDRLNTSFYASNEDYIAEVEVLLKENMSQLHSNYDSLHFYLSDIGSNWTETEHYDYAINVLNISDHLYPDIAYTKFFLGIAYYGIHDRSTGDEYFTRCITLDKTREKDIQEFKKEWIEWWGE